MAEPDASYFHPHLPLSLPEYTCTVWNVKEIIFIICEKKPSAPFLAFNSSSGWGFERILVLVTVEASIYEAHCCFLSVLHQLLVLALLCVAPPPVVLLEQIRHRPHVSSCPECEDVHSSVTLFAIVAERMQRSTVGLHHEQHLCIRSVTWSPSGKNNECIKRRPFPSTLYYHTLFFNVLPCWLWELECFLRFSMNDAFTLPFRFGDRRKSFLPLDRHCSSGLKALFRREKKTAQQAIYRDSRLGSRASTSTSASFRPKSIAIRRVRSRPRNAPFFHGN